MREEWNENTFSSKLKKIFVIQSGKNNFKTLWNSKIIFVIDKKYVGMVIVQR